MPKVSIITAAYNHVQFVRHSVESALNQTYRDFEYIVVDDGTTDGTAEVLQSFGNRIKYIRQENRGTPAAVNAAIRASSGEYIAFLDSDDAWLPQKLERQMPAFDECREAGMVYSQSYVIDAAGKLKDGLLLGKRLKSNTAFEELLRDDPIPVGTAVVKRSCLDAVGGLSEALKSISDWDLWIRICSEWPIIFVAEPLALYRIHGRNTFIRVNESGQVERERLQMLRDIDNFLPASVSRFESNRSRAKATFTYTVLRHSYGLFSRSQYSKGIAYLAYAFKLRPAFLKDLPAALRLDLSLFTNGKPRRIISNLLLGQGAHAK